MKTGLIENKENNSQMGQFSGLAKLNINMTWKRFQQIRCPRNDSLRSWRDFVRECFRFGSEAVNASGEAVRGLVKSRVDPASYAGYRNENFFDLLSLIEMGHKTHNPLLKPFTVCTIFAWFCIYKGFPD